MAPHSSTLAWKIPWMGEPGGLPSMKSLEAEAQVESLGEVRSSNTLFS